MVNCLRGHHSASEQVGWNSQSELLQGPMDNHAHLADDYRRHLPSCMGPPLLLRRILLSERDYLPNHFLFIWGIPCVTLESVAVFITRRKNVTERPHSERGFTLQLYWNTSRLGAQHLVSSWLAESADSAMFVSYNLHNFV